MSDKNITVALLGVGRVGRDLSSLLTRRPGLSVVAACSRNPAIAGQDLGLIAGGTRSGVLVTDSRDDALAHGADVAVLATTSFITELADDIRAAIAAGHNVLCTGEETAFPWAVDYELASKLDAEAREAGVTVLGAGVNPGFLFDALLLTLSGAAWDVSSIHVGRVVDVSHFSPTVLGRLGIGYTPEEFARERAGGRIHGHIGFPQSMHVVAQALGCEIERIEEEVEPLVAERAFRGDNLEVEVGHTAGFVQRYTGFVDGRAWFNATMTGHLDPDAIGADRRDTIRIDGEVSVALAIDPALEAQPTVAAVLANSLTRIVAAPPGWITVGDLPPAISVAG